MKERFVRAACTLLQVLHNQQYYYTMSLIFLANDVNSQRMMMAFFPIYQFVGEHICRRWCKVRFDDSWGLWLWTGNLYSRSRPWLYCRTSRTQGQLLKFNNNSNNNNIIIIIFIIIIIVIVVVVVVVVVIIIRVWYK